jgi:uncharacterized protein YcfL
MKKVIFVFLVAAILVACNNTSTSAVAGDSTTVDSSKVDTCKVKCDSTTKVDTVKKAK